MSSRQLLWPLAFLVMAGCQTTDRGAGSLDAGFGEAVKYDTALQVINPDPVYDESDAQPGDNGAKAAAAAKRYRTDQVKQVDTQTTTTSASGSSSGPR